MNISNLRVIGRNYDTLIIGEPVELKILGNIGKSITLSCPERSLYASTIIAYRLFRY